MEKGNLFAYASAAVVIVALIFSPKRITKKELYATSFVMVALTIYTDLFFGLILDLYDFIKPEITLSDLVLQALLPPSCGVLAMNFMPSGTKRFIVYLVAVCALALLFEWLSVRMGYLIYKGWKLYYSLPIYTIGVLYLRWHLRFLRKGEPPNAY